MIAHPIANVFPEMSAAEFAALKEDIAEHGVREPVWTWRGQVLDGRHRARACRELGIECPEREYDGDESELVAFVVSLNLKRRHLDESQRAMVAAAIAKLEKGANQHAQICAPSQSDAAEMLNVSRRSVQAAKKVIDDGAPELREAVEHGEVSVSAAAEVVDLPKREQKKLVRAGTVQERAAELRKERKPVEPDDEVGRLTEELQDAKDQIRELTQQLEEMQAEIVSLQVVEEAGDKVKAALAEAKKFRELNRILEERIRGYQNEKNAAIQSAKSWQRKYEQALKGRAA